MNADEGRLITKWNTARSALTNLIESYEYIKTAGALVQVRSQQSFSADDSNQKASSPWLLWALA